MALEMVAAEARLRVAEQQAQEPSLGLARTTQQTQKHFKTSSTAESTTFSLEARKSSLELTIHDMLCNKTEAWQTSGTWMVVTSCVT